MGISAQVSTTRSLLYLVKVKLLVFVLMLSAQDRFISLLESYCTLYSGYP